MNNTNLSTIWKFADDVDTDQIVPGRYAPYMRPDEDVGNAAFIEAHPEFNQQAKPGDIILAGSNFGCGSSREYAPLALRRREVKAIIAKSFARIFFRNAINLGIPVYTAPDLYDQIADQEQVEFDLQSSLVRVQGREFALPPLPEFAQQTIEAGGISNFVKQHGTFPGTLSDSKTSLAGGN